jgi:HPt (histidine-containing phosphotransfer) domain-containing protein
MNAKDELDPQALERLRRLGKGGKFVRDMIDLFLSYAPARLADAHAGLQSGDLGAVATAVHPLKSGAGNMGALTVQDLAGQIEQLASEQKPDTLPALLQELDLALARAQSQLEETKRRLEV